MDFMKSKWPQRIACITAETTELVFALGAGDRIVGVSGFSVRPAEARSKPKVAAFTSVRLDKLRPLRPDLILGFSDLQKDIACELIAEGFTVFISNQRTLQETADMILAVGRLIGEEKKAVKLNTDFWSTLEKLRGKNARSRPRIYFEEWDGPLISGISWVSELIEFLGGEDVFKKNRAGKNAKDRVVLPEEVIAADPEAIIASWCGKKVQFDKIKSRPGWEQIQAVRNNQLYEIKSSDILAPGLSLLHGARRMAEILRKVTPF